jgi:predicted ester cyclase
MNLPMILDSNKSIVQRYINEVLNQGRQELITALFAPHMHEQVQRIFNEVRGAFPDMHETLEDLVAEGNRVMARWTFRGTQRGHFLDIPPTGKHIEITGFSIYYLENGVIVKDYAVLDWLDALEQLGATILPPPSSG